ncbi:insulinase family protein [Seonamhaeicola sp. MEBiC1930]|uniref:M16 family metallopeptidase n=1 Tax=Seonamhaeicola sp. MEBiC01930 TaxID=2976768 RepID=UPI0032469DBA
MKTKLIITISVLFISVGLHAQIDRTIQPEPGPAPKIQLQTPVEYTLNNGLKVMVVENHKLPRVSFNLTIDNIPSVQAEKKGVSDLLATLLGNGTTSISKDSFNEEIDFLGANLNFNASGGFASGLSKYSDRLLKLMADATVNPLFEETEFDKEKDRLIESLKTGEKSVDAVAGRVALALAYGAHHPYGEYITEETLNNISLDDVKAFYHKNFNPENAYLVIIGDIDFKTIKKQVKKYFGAWEKPINLLDNTVPSENPNVEHTQINFVDMPNAVQSNVTVMNTTKLKRNDPDYHSVLIANSILGGGATGYLFKNLRVKHAYTYGSYSGINPSKYASRFRANAKVRNMVTDSSIVQILKELKRIRTEDVDSTLLADTKAQYAGNFVMALEKPQTMAQYALNIKLYDLPQDFYATFLEKVNAVSVEDIKRAANKHFKIDNSRILVVGKGSDVIPNLEKTGIPIKYFDKYANSIEKPEFSKPIPEGINAQTVIDNYFKAIGGKEKAKKINTVFMSADVTIEGVPIPITAELKIMTPNKESLEMSAQGMGVLMKQKFNGATGYAEQQGKKIDLTANEIAKKKNEKSLFPELYYEASALALESITTIDGEDVYKIKVTTEEKSSFRFYGVKSGLLLLTESTVEAQGQTFNSIVKYSEYAAVNDMQIPYLQSIKSGPQSILMKMKDIKINEGVTDADFE